MDESEENENGSGKLKDQSGASAEQADGMPIECGANPRAAEKGGGGVRDRRAQDRGAAVLIGGPEKREKWQGTANREGKEGGLQKDTTRGR